VVGRVARGFTNKEIAGERGVGIAAVKDHGLQRSQECGMRNRASLAVAADKTAA
jgi:DNA-binding NarL/FixJ family response regulator